MSNEPTSLEAKKEALNRQTEIYKQAIEEQVSVMKDNAGHVTKRALMVGAGLVASYFLVKAFAKPGKKKLKQLKHSASQKLIGSGSKSSNNSNNQYFIEGMSPADRYQQSHATKDSGISSLITQQIAIFLIGIATQKLQEFFNNSRRTHTEPISRNDNEYTEPIYIK